MTTIVNAAPMTIFNGIKDDSTTSLTLAAEQVPDHLPLFYLYAQKGPTTPQLLVGNGRVTTYGSDTFDLTKGYARHPTVLSNLVNDQGNAAYYVRLQPSDAPKAASVRISLDLLTTQVDPYVRNADGSIQYNNSTGLPVTVGTKIAGYIAKCVAEVVPLDGNGDDTFGLGVQSVGTQTDATTTTHSVRYPLFDADVSSFGAWGANQALRIWAPTQTGTDTLDSRILTQELVYPFRLSMVSRASTTSTPTVTSTVAGAQYVNFCLKPKTLDQNTEEQLYIGDVVPAAFQSINNADSTPDTLSPFGRFYTYDANVKAVLDLVYAAELPKINEFSDFTGQAGEEYLFNLFTGVSSLNVPYSSYQVVVDSASPVRFSSTANIYAQGGGDGTMSDLAFDTAVALEVTKFSDPSSEWQDLARYPVSDLYDTGFTIATKKALAAFIALRPDTFLTLGLHDVIAGTKLDDAAESSLAAALLATVQGYPESSYFGTPATRAMIVARSGILTGSTYTKRVPCTFEIGVKAAKYMGASSGIWDKTENFDQAPGSVLDYMTDINVTWTPATVRNTDWNNGLVGVQSYDTRRYLIPALKTVNTDDTSILTSYFNARICANLEKVGNKARIEFSGESSLTNAQLIKGVKAFIQSKILNKYADRVTVIPSVYFTAQDTLRGYSFTIKIDVYGPSMITVATLSIDVHRIADLPTTTTTTNTTTSV